MLDRYWYGSTSRISPEAPVPVVHVGRAEERPGGAGNVAVNIQALGTQAHLLAMTGDDEAADILQDQLERLSVECFLQRHADLSTITKLRVISAHQQMMRLDFEKDFSTVDNTALIEKFKTALQNAQAVILSDYAKGCLADIETFILAAQKENVPVFIDPKGHDFSRYCGATMLTPNKKEFEAVVGLCADEETLANKGLTLLKQLQLQALLITRGDQGMSLIREGHSPVHIPVRSREVFDVTGAGDTVIAVLASAVAAGADFETATHLSNMAASISVTKLGAATVTVPELRRAVHKMQISNNGVLTEKELLFAVSNARLAGEKLVFTNGCFDILHAGHVAYLEQAKALGDRLIVAVNDDASVKCLKGAGRPVNGIEHRMAVLAGLGSVDWVLSFPDETPVRLLKQIEPDVLVKGGDYSETEVVGHEVVKAQGGEVNVLTVVEGCSTTSVVERIQNIADTTHENH